MNTKVILLPLLLCLLSACDATSPPRSTPEASTASRSIIEPVSASPQEVGGERSTESASVRYPEPLHGVWDIGPGPCVLSEGTESDSRFEITSEMLQGYEHVDVPRSIVRISESPQVWQIIAVSNIAPPEIQQDADIYTLDGNKLTIGDGQNKKAYVRCTH